MILSNAECKALNYLVHELISNGVPFEFVNPTSTEYSRYLRWESIQNPTVLVDGIIDTALARKSVVLIGSLYAGNWNDGDSYFVGYKPIDA